MDESLRPFMIQLWTYYSTVKKHFYRRIAMDFMALYFGNANIQFNIEDISSRVEKLTRNNNNNKWITTVNETTFKIHAICLRFYSPTVVHALKSLKGLAKGKWNRHLLKGRETDPSAYNETLSLRVTWGANICTYIRWPNELTKTFNFKSNSSWTLVHTSCMWEGDHTKLGMDESICWWYLGRAK